MNTHCPICGKAFTPLDVVLSGHDAKYQCRHCWNRIQATGPVTRIPGGRKMEHAPAGPEPRRSHHRKV